MTPEQRRAIAAKGGKTAHALGKAHCFTYEEATQAGRKGGIALHLLGKQHVFTPEEAAVAGREGMLGSAVLLGASSNMFEELCQIEDGVLGLPANLLLREIEADSGIRRVFLGYVASILQATARSVSCNRLHSSDQRLARWLLQVRDRVESDTFYGPRVQLQERQPIDHRGQVTRPLSVKELRPDGDASSLASSQLSRFSHCRPNGAKWSQPRVKLQVSRGQRRLRDCRLDRDGYLAADRGAQT